MQRLVRAVLSLVIMPATVHLVVYEDAAAGPRSSWKLSCYAYRDVNRNGIFDMGDRPFGGLPVEITRPDGSTVTIPSNIDGFANFVVTLGDTDEADLFEAGDHSARYYPPSGWIRTSEEKLQVLTLEVIDGAPGGMFVAETCVPIGVAPVLNISGAFSPAEDSTLGQYELSIAHESGKTYDIPFDSEGRFEFVGYPGKWTVTFLDKKRNARHTRSLELKDAAVVLSHFNLPAEPVEENDGAITTVYFDDLTVSDALFEIPSGYGGLNWRNWIAVHNRFYLGAGYVNATVSSEYVAYNSSGTPAWMASEKPFDFVGSYIGAAWPRGEEKDVVVRAWRGDKLVYEDRLSIHRAGPVYFSANYRDINKVEIVSDIWARIAIDNFSFRP